jgi:hypothetical protein
MKVTQEDRVEALARDICNTYYLTVDPLRPMVNAFDKITEKTREHWRNQARAMLNLGYRKRRLFV